MEHNGFNKKDTYICRGSFKYTEIRQIEMIKKNYSDYSKDDFVLWIVPELFHDYISEELTGIIKVRKKDGSFIEVPHMLRTLSVNYL